MAINLSKPLAWKAASTEEQKMLQCLQGNILKGHGRTETVNIFFKMDPLKALEMKRALRELANYHITTADRQLRETEDFHKCGKPGLTFVSVFISATGYSALGLTAQAPTTEPQFFTEGMRHATSVAEVSDKLTDWEACFNQQIDGMILVGDNDRRLAQFKRDAVAKLLKEGGATIVHEQIGSAVKNKANDGIEHFGYVDGRSQPLLLVEDIEREANTAGSVRWDPAFSLGAALVKDPSVTDTVSFGSYFIFRKLEQNVQGFKRQEQVLATKLKFEDAEKRELAGALVVGRFEDGTPVTLTDEAKGANPPNDFNYENDAAGNRCPFHAHIRKVNPRHDVASERAHIMPRRGIPFTDVARKVHPSDLPGSKDLKDFDDNVKDDLPTGGVGLLFMAYNSNLTKQFVFTQKSWANEKDFPSTGVGADPIIGQGPDTSVLQTWPVTWDDPATATEPFNFANFVTMRGGEYFFAPSLTFFKNL